MAAQPSYAAVHRQESTVVFLCIKAVPQAHGKQRQLKKFAPYAPLTDLHLGQEPAVGGCMVINGKNQRRKIHRRFKRGGHDGMNISVPVEQIAPLRTVHKCQIRQFRFCAVHKRYKNRGTRARTGNLPLPKRTPYHWAMPRVFIVAILPPKQIKRGLWGLFFVKIYLRPPGLEPGTHRL